MPSAREAAPELRCAPLAQRGQAPLDAPRCQSSTSSTGPYNMARSICCVLALLLAAHGAAAALASTKAPKGVQNPPQLILFTVRGCLWHARRLARLVQGWHLRASAWSWMRPALNSAAAALTAPFPVLVARDVAVESERYVASPEHRRNPCFALASPTCLAARRRRRPSQFQAGTGPQRLVPQPQSVQDAGDLVRRPAAAAAAAGGRDWQGILGLAAGLARTGWVDAPSVALCSAGPPRPGSACHSESNGSTATQALVTPISARRFACTGSCSFQCSEALKLYKKGHEIAVHTIHHKDLRQLKKSDVSARLRGGPGDGSGLDAQASPVHAQACIAMDCSVQGSCILHASCPTPSLPTPSATDADQKGDLGRARRLGQVRNSQVRPQRLPHSLFV